jgi:pimeloyl-ACP methyl ester carboxylesterase
VKTVLALMLAAFLTGCGGSGSGDSTVPVKTQLLPEPQVPTPTYGTIGGGPVIVVLALDEASTLHDGDSTGGIVPDLISAGYTVLSMDLPCQGADADPTVSNPLYCWAKRLAAGDRDFFVRFCAGLSDVLDAAAIKKAGLLGLSRGGYMATVCAAYDARFTAIVLENPLTDLNYLTEFKQMPVDESLYNLQQYIPYLEGRRKMLSIDKVDVRVGASLAISFGQQLGAEIEVTDAPNHTITPAVASAAAQWFVAQGAF